MSNPIEHSQPSRTIKATILTLTITTLCLLLQTHHSTTPIHQNLRKLWAQNIYWAGNPNIQAPAPPPPKQVWKQPNPPKHHYQPKPPAPRPAPKGNPFEKIESGNSAKVVSSSSSVKSPPPPVPAPRIPPPVSPAPPSGSGISSSSYYSRPSNQYAVVNQVDSSSLSSQEEEALTVEEELPNIADGFMIGSPKQESAPAQTVQQIQPMTQQQQVVASSQTTTLTSSLELSGIPSPLPPPESMERMALLNLLVHRIEMKLTSLETTANSDVTTVVKEITIVKIGNVDIITRRLRGMDLNPRLLWSSSQVVTFEAVLEYKCDDEEEKEACKDNAETLTKEIIHELDPTTMTTSNEKSSNVDNEGEDWSNIHTSPSSSFVWIPNPSEIDVEVITAKPTNMPTSNPTSPPTSHPIFIPTHSPTLNPIEQSMQTYSVNIEIETSSKPTMKPISNKPTSPTAITENEWFSNAGLFQGDASKRYCGYDWADVVSHCLTATPCPQGHAEGICPYGMTCIADTPCDEVRAQESESELMPTSSSTSTTTSTTTTTTSSSTSSEATTEFVDMAAAKRFCGYDWANVVRSCLVATPCPDGIAEGVCPNGMGCIDATPCDEVRAQNQAVVIARQPVVVPASSSTTTTTSSTTTTEQAVEQVQPADMGMMMSNTDPSPNDIQAYESFCKLHSDCPNQLCGLPNSGFEGMCVDCLFNNHIGCRASQICILSFETNMPVCDNRPLSTSSTTTTTTTTTTTSTTSVTTTDSTTTTQTQDNTSNFMYLNPPDNQYFCGLTYSSITDTCLESKPCPTGIAAIHCGLQEGCFAHLPCQSQYEEEGAIETGSSDSMSAFAAFDKAEMGGNDGSVEGYDSESYWADTWRDNNSAYTSSCTTLLLTGFMSGFLFLLL